MRGFAAIVLSTVVVSAALAASPAAAASRVAHQLQVVLDPGSSRLQGCDRLVAEPGGEDALTVYLNPRARVAAVKVNGKAASLSGAGGRFRLALPAERTSGSISVEICYSGIFDDPAPAMPVNTDNPGYGVAGSIGPRGTFLLAGAGWYPHIEAETVTYTLRVEAPEGVVAVTAGRSLGTHTADGKTVSNWQVDYPVRGLALSAAAYEVRRKSVRQGVTAETYFLPETRDLADTYLEATVAYIRLYESLFGEYPFEKFAVVENFFPTGYGFPSYTLMGGRVLRLPFIVQTSLGHEIAHCWWGNGVYVDADRGNWSEALTTYVADYLYKERESEAAARDYRLQILRNFATLVDAGSDFALQRFTGRTDPVTKTVGYDKGAMVFHMLRRHIGDSAFWGALGDIYRQRRFEPTGWDDLQRAFERRAGEPLGWFFRQWVDRKGAPDLRLADLSVAAVGRQWVVRGQLIQAPPYYDVSGTLAIQTAAGDVTRRLAATGAATAFAVECNAPPQTVMFDPQVDLFRRLAASEIPATVNSLKGAKSVLVVLTGDGHTDRRAAADTLVAALGLDSPAFIHERELDADRLRRHNLLFVGLPQKPSIPVADQPVELRPASFALNGTTYEDPTDAFFGVFPHPDLSGGVVAVFLPLSDTDARQVARLVTHYGKYSYLVFQKGRNLQKGTWPVAASPVVVRWADANRSPQEKR